MEAAEGRKASGGQDLKTGGDTIVLNKIKKKLHSRAGESIGETLVAVLISALALTMLAGAISTAARLITKNKTSMETYYSASTTEATQKKVQNTWDNLVTAKNLK